MIGQEQSRLAYATQAVQLVLEEGHAGPGSVALADCLVRLQAVPRILDPVARRRELVDLAEIVRVQAAVLKAKPAEWLYAAANLLDQYGYLTK